jgi:periplasmic protein TonB
MRLRMSCAEGLSLCAHALALGTLIALQWRTPIPAPKSPRRTAVFLAHVQPPSPPPPAAFRGHPDGFDFAADLTNEGEDEAVTFPPLGIVLPGRGVLGCGEGGFGGVVTRPLDGTPGLPPVPDLPLISTMPLRAGRDVAAPTKLVNLPPRYPAVARSARIEGTVILDATIDESGKVIDARVLRSTRALDDAAVEAVMRWRYAPARLRGVPVRVLLTVTVTFVLPH